MIVGGNLGIRGWAIYGEDMAKGITLCNLLQGIYGRMCLTTSLLERHCILATASHCQPHNYHFCAYVYIVFFVHDFVFSFYLHYTKTLYTTKTHSHQLSAITVFSYLNAGKVVSWSSMVGSCVLNLDILQQPTLTDGKHLKSETFLYIFSL